MSGVGFWELVLVFLIGLIVLGPERLPRVASQLGSWLGQARRMTRVMRRQLEDELNLEKDLSIRPRQSRLPPPAAATNRHDTDDGYSPAHDADAQAAADAAPNGSDENNAGSPADEIPEVGSEQEDGALTHQVVDVDAIHDNDSEAETDKAPAPDKTK